MATPRGSQKSRALLEEVAGRTARLSLESACSQAIGQLQKLTLKQAGEQREEHRDRTGNGT